MTDAEKEKIIAQALSTKRGRTALVKAILAPFRREQMQAYVPVGASMLIFSARVPPTPTYATWGGYRMRAAQTMQ